MGLSLPSSGKVYLDTDAIIYAVERHPRYSQHLVPLWEAARNGELTITASELALMETLVVPMRNGDSALRADYEKMLLGADIEIVPITAGVLREAARPRALIPSLRSPDAIHAATSMSLSCALFITNDVGFRNISELPIVLLDGIP